jgi:alpha-3'-ketoglucosidase
MKSKILFSLLFIGVFILSCSETAPIDETPKTEELNAAESPPHNILSDEEKAEGWQLLFDGVTTTGWRGYNKATFPTKGWEVKNGELHVIKSGTEEEGFGGDIITTESFENFDLTLEYMLTDSSNSGILYLVKEEPDQAIWYNAPEYQILDNETYKTMGATNLHFTAANYDLHPATTDYTKPKGEWNQVKIIVNKGHVEHWLNGNKVVEYELWSPEWETLVQKSKFKDYPNYGKNKKGPIGLQDHGHLVRYRDIKIKRL